MGIAFWTVAAVAAFLLARLAPWRRRGVAGELALSIVTALILGVAATALDFGGWREPDWRSALFALFGALAAIGLRRLIGA